MTFSVDKFMAETPAKRGRPRTSEIWKFKEEILRLRNSGYSYKQIMMFLEKNQVEVKYQALVSFVRRVNLLAQAEEAAASGSKTSEAQEAE